MHQCVQQRPASPCTSGANECGDASTLWNTLHVSFDDEGCVRLCLCAPVCAYVVYLVGKQGFYGVCIDSELPWLVIEYMAGGGVDSYYRGQRAADAGWKPSSKHALSWSLDIIRGVTYMRTSPIPVLPLVNFILAYTCPRRCAQAQRCTCCRRRSPNMHMLSASCQTFLSSIYP